MDDLTPNDLSHLSDEEFLALCPQGYHAPGPEPLSPAAQAVLDGVEPVYGWRWMVPLASLQRNSISRGNTMTTTPDFRALYAELLVFAEQAAAIAENEGLWPACDLHDFKLLDRARTALATPPPEPLRPIPVSERLQQMEDLAADTLAGLRYIEQNHGRLYGVGWDRVYEKADRLKPTLAIATELEGRP